MWVHQSGNALRGRIVLLAAVLVLVAFPLVTWVSFAASAAPPVGTKPPVIDTTGPYITVPTLPPRPTTTTSSTTTTSTTTSTSTTLPLATTTTLPPPVTTSSTTTTTAPTTTTNPDPDCLIVPWFGMGVPYPGVPLEYQNIPFSMGQWMIYGTGFVPGEWVTMVIDGVDYPGSLALVDQYGSFSQGNPNITSWIGDPTLADVIPPKFTAPFVVTVQGSACDASATAEPPNLPGTCALHAWWGYGSEEPGVPPAYQDPQGDLGYLNLYGSGYTPEKRIYLFKDGMDQGVGDGWAETDSTGAFHVNLAILGGQMMDFQYGQTPFTITAKGPLCSASQMYTGPTNYTEDDERVPLGTIGEIDLDIVAVDDSPLPPPKDSGPPYLAIGLAAVAGAGVAAGGFLMFRRRGMAPPPPPVG